MKYKYHLSRQQNRDIAYGERNCSKGKFIPYYRLSMCSFGTYYPDLCLSQYVCFTQPCSRRCPLKSSSHLYKLKLSLCALARLLLWKIRCRNQVVSLLFYALSFCPPIPSHPCRSNKTYSKRIGYLRNVGSHSTRVARKKVRSTTDDAIWCQTTLDAALGLLALLEGDFVVWLAHIWCVLACFWVVSDGHTNANLKEVKLACANLIVG